MQRVTVPRLQLLEKIKANRENHRALFLKAQEGYRERVLEELDHMLRLARDGGQLRVRVGLDAPEDHTDDYDRVIAMLEMSVEETITIDALSFDNYVRDHWAWSDAALFKNSTYASGGSIKRE